EPAINTVVFYFHDKVWKRIEAKKQHELGVIPFNSDCLKAYKLG
ncbi:MAG: DUF2061 domain-containing protein, partial [Shewanella sp.]